MIARDRRAGLAENNSLLLREARGRFCLLLNEDSELLDGRRRGAAGGAERRSRGGRRGGSAPGSRRQPDSLRVAVARARHARSPRRSSCTAGWSPRAAPAAATAAARGGLGPVGAMLVRREAAEEVGYLDPDFFVYSEEVDFQKRMRDAGWRILHVPAARAIHHEQLATDRSAGARRVVQFHRGRDDLHAKAPLAPGRLRSPPPVGVVVRAARVAAVVHARTRARLVLAPRPPGAPPHARRGDARGAPRPTTASSSRADGTPKPRSGPRPVLVAGGSLVDLGPEPRLSSRRPRRRGRRRRAQAAGSRGDRGGAEQLAASRSAPPRGGTRTRTGPRVGEPEHGAAARGRRSPTVGSSASPAPTSAAAESTTSARRRHSYGTGKSRCVNAYISTSTTT